MNDNNGNLQEKRRFDFLMGMYSEMWGNVNRHLTVIWQSVGVLGAGFALFTLTEKHVVGTDAATAAMVVICFWLMANAYVASEWFNRNQAIISNIERQFLRRGDLREINPYFDKRRKPGNMVSHVRVQWSLRAALTAFVLIRHFFVEVVPYLRSVGSANLYNVDWKKAVPYLVFVAGLIWIRKIRSNTVKGEEQFQRECPGRNIGESAVSSAIVGNSAGSVVPSAPTGAESSESNPTKKISDEAKNA